MAQNDSCGERRTETQGSDVTNEDPRGISVEVEETAGASQESGQDHESVVRNRSKQADREKRPGNDCDLSALEAVVAGRHVHRIGEARHSHRNQQQPVEQVQVSREVDLPTEGQVDDLRSQMNEHQWKGRKTHDDRFQSLSDVGNVIDEADHRGHEEDADCGEKRVLADVPQELLEAHHETHRNGEREESRDPPEFWDGVL